MDFDYTEIPPDPIDSIPPDPLDGPGGRAGSTPLAFKRALRKKSMREPFMVAKDDTLSPAEKDRQIADYYGVDFLKMTKSPQYVPGILADKVVKDTDLQYSIGQTGGGVIPLGLAQGATGLVSNANRLLTRAGKAVGIVGEGTTELNDILHNLNEYNYRYSTSDPNSGKGYPGQDFYHAGGTVASSLPGDKLIRGAGAVSNFARGAVAGASTPTVVNYNESGGNDLAGQLLKNTSVGGVTNAMLAPAMRGVANVIQNPREAVKESAQRVFNINPAQQAKAKLLQKNIDRLNSKFGTNVDLTVGELTGNSGVKRLETTAEYLPGGMRGVRETQNAESRKLVEAKLADLQKQLKAAPWENIELITKLAEGGDDGAKNILALMKKAGNDPSMIVDASPEAKKLLVKVMADKKYNLFRRLTKDSGAIDVSRVISSIDDTIAKIEPMIGKEEGPYSGLLKRLKDRRDELSGAMETRAYDLNPPTPGQPKTILEPDSTGLMQTERTVVPEVPPRPEPPVDISPEGIRQWISNQGDTIYGLDQTNPFDRKLGGLAKQPYQAARGALKGSLDEQQLAALEGANNWFQENSVPINRTRIARRLGNIEVPDQIVPTFFKKNEEGLARQFSGALESRGRLAATTSAFGDAVELGSQGHPDVFNGSQVANNLKGRPYAELIGSAPRANEPFSALELSGVKSGVPAPPPVPENLQDINQIREYLQLSDRNTRAMMNPDTGQRLTGIELAKAFMTPGHMGVGMASGMAMGPLAKQLFAKQFGKKLLLESPEVLAVNPMIEEIMSRYMARGASALPMSGEVE